ncbi:MAG: hypothetical protein F6K24_36820 [Okeania sp. SIO2D1]|nr:hypothetical protein [Okeania sp. SIO2D1]
MNGGQNAGKINDVGKVISRANRHLQNEPRQLKVRGLTRNYAFKVQVDCM